MSRYFSNDYYEAKEKFLQTALSKNCKIFTYKNPCLGPQGGALTTDVAYLGPKNPKKLFVTVSAVHGAEGFYGSACQTAYLDKYQSKHDDLALLFIHAINPN